MVSEAEKQQVELKLLEAGECKHVGKQACSQALALCTKWGADAPLY
ncbi:hypothetical protein O9992_26775 [Vibrio lentus]|nr:hypothetical protein [Vibrio lentus]